MTFAILGAISTAALFASAEVTMRNAMRGTTPVMTSIVTLSLQWLIYTGLVLAAGGFRDLGHPGVLWFILAGVANPFLFLFFYLLGIYRIGVSRSSPVKSAAPVYAVFIAVLFLGERLHAIQFVGIALVIGGILIISMERGAEARVSGARETAPGGDVRRSGLLFALLAGMAAGVASVLFKAGMNRLQAPLLGAWIGTTEALLLFPVAALLFPAADRFRIRRAVLPWLGVAAVFNTLGFYLLLHSIGLGQVSIVFTLAQTSPLFVILLSVLFLREVERVTLRVMLGALLAVGGGALVSLF